MTTRVGATNGARPQGADGLTMTPPPLPRLAWTAEEVASSLGLCIETIRRATREGSLPCHRFGRAIRYTERDIEVFLSNKNEYAYPP